MIFIFEGDCNNCIYLWEPTSAGTWNVDNAPFIGHTASVEDLQVCLLICKAIVALLVVSV